MSPLAPLGLFAFAPTAGGDYESIATVSITSGTQQDITFSSIPSTYKHLQLRGVVFTNGATNPAWQVNGDTTGANYSGHHLWGTGSAAVSNNQSGTVYWNYNPDSTYPSCFVMDFLDYANTNKYKTMRTQAGVDTNGGTVETALWSGSWLQTTAINSITLKGLGAYFRDGTHIALYGIKG